MCNRIRGLKEWGEIPRSLTRSLINFEYNPNVAPTEQVPAFLAERGKPLATRMARFGINLASSGGKRHPPLLNARTDSLRRMPAAVGVLFADTLRRQLAIGWTVGTLASAGGSAGGSPGARSEPAECVAEK